MLIREKIDVTELLVLFWTPVSHYFDIFKNSENI